MRCLRSLALTMLLAVATVEARGQAPTLSPARNLLSGQPIGFVVGIFAGDYERSVGRDGLTLGVGASYVDDRTLAFKFDDASFRYTSLEAKARYYFGGKAFDGFSAGLTVGGAHARENDVAFSATGLKLGSEFDYTWLLGRRRRVAIALGVGGKRIFYHLTADDAGSARLNTAYVTSRIALGLAF